MKYTIGMLVSLAAFLSGCSSMSDILLQNVPKDYEIASNNEVGVVIVSTRFLSEGCPAESTISSAMLAIFNDRDSTGRAGDTLFMRSPIVAIDPLDPARQLFVRKLPAGNYSIRQAGYVFGVLPRSPLVNYDPHTVKEVNIPFAVTAGQAHYLGEVVVNAEACRNLTVKVNNQRKRDLDQLALRLTKIDPASIKDQILVPVSTQ